MSFDNPQWYETEALLACMDGDRETALKNIRLLDDFCLDYLEGGLSLMSDLIEQVREEGSNVADSGE